MQTGDGDGFDAFSLEIGQRPPNILFTDVFQDVPVAVDPLFDAAPQVTRAQRRRIPQEEIVNRVALLAAHLQDVAESGRGQQADQRAFTLDNCVGDQCRAMEEVAKLLMA